MKITPVVASRFVSDGGTMFGLVPKAIWSKMIEPDAHNCIPQSANCLFIEFTDGRTALVDTGCGPAWNFPPRRAELHGLSQGWPLADRLAGLGTSPEELDFVVLSHLHWDHAGGIVNHPPGEERRASFPRAVHIVHAVEWQDATSNNPLLYKSYPPEISDVLNNAIGERLTLIQEDEREVLPGVKLVRTGGHTRGHCMVVLEDAELQLQHPRAGDVAGAPLLVFAADVCPTRHHFRLVFQMAYDTFPLDTRAWKREWLPRIAGEGHLLMFDHDPDLCGATLRHDEKKEYVVDIPLAAS